jgi:hypothetical protein
MTGDDTIRIEIKVGKRRDSPLGGEFRSSGSKREYVSITASDLDKRAVRGQCIAALNRILNELAPGVQ